MADPLAATIRTIAGDANVFVDADMMSSYESDWTRRFHGHARMVIRPANTAEVAAVIRACAAAGASIVTQGGNTSLVGGGLPDGDVVLSTARLGTIGAIDPAADEAIVGAGVTCAALNAAASANGLRLGVDLASRDSATIGGMVSTNAGGINVLRYGMMRAQVLGLEFVLANGEVVNRLVGPAKDNTGYDLVHLLAGSEGTLAIITRIRVRLVPVYAATAVALLGFDTTEAAISVVLAAKRLLPDLEAAEFFVADGLALVRKHTNMSSPFARAYPFYVLLEVASHLDTSNEFAAFLDGAVTGGDIAFATSRPDRARLWAYRERHTEAINAEGVPIKLDTAIPLGSIGRFLAEAPAVARAACPSARVVLFGHIAEGSIHVNLLGAEPNEDAVTTAVLELVAELGGSISAEHGIGIAKTPWLHLTRSAADIAAMRAIKHAMDPAGTLNRRVIFPLDTIKL